jgi:hypothetical protein
MNWLPRPLVLSSTSTILHETPRIGKGGDQLIGSDHRCVVCCECVDNNSVFVLVACRRGKRFTGLCIEYNFCSMIEKFTATQINDYQEGSELRRSVRQASYSHISFSSPPLFFSAGRGFETHPSVIRGSRYFYLNIKRKQKRKAKG